MEFEYYTPTKVYFGTDAELSAGPYIKSCGYKKVLVHFGGQSAVKSGLIDRVTKNLAENGLEYVTLGGVEPNPKIAMVRQGIELCQKENVDFLLAVGGGSVLDSIKGISLGLYNNKDPWAMIEDGDSPKGQFPMGSIITIAAAGSEMSDSCVITNPDLKLKRSINGPFNRPMVAFMNPELTYTVSKFQTGCGIVDIMMHTFERYFTADSRIEPTDSIAEAIITSVRDAGRVAIAEPDNYDARATLMWSGSLSHNGLTGCGKHFWFVNHKIEHDFSGVFDSIAHGAGLGVIFPAWAKFSCKFAPERFARFARNIWGITAEGTDEEIGLMGIDALIAYFREIGMPTTLAELGVTPESYEEVADKCTDGGKNNLPSFQPLTKADLLEIYKLAE